MRYIYKICQICHHLRFYKMEFSKSFFSSLLWLVHGIILSESIVGLKKIARSCINGKSQQALSTFLNATKDTVFRRLYSIRLDVQVALANKLTKQHYSFFIIDDYLFKKRKNKKTQGAGYNFCHDAKKARKSQCVVSSSCLINGFHIPFKHAFYVGLKYISKTKFKKKLILR
jgi:hypothetical protein